MVGILGDDFQGAVCAIFAQLTQLQLWILLAVVRGDPGTPWALGPSERQTGPSCLASHAAVKTKLNGDLGNRAWPPSPRKAVLVWSL